MKCFFITASMVGGGTERVISVLANDFAKDCNDVNIILTADRRVDYTLEESVSLKFLTDATGGSNIKRMERIIKLRRLMKNNRTSVFYSFGTETNMFAILASLGLGVNLILSERNDPNQCGFKILRDMIYYWGKKYVFQTEQAKEHFSKRIKKRSVVISNPLRDDLPDEYLQERKKTIVAVGRLTPQKNYKLLLLAFAAFHKDFPEFDLQIFGQGSEQEILEEYARQLEIDTFVSFMGFSKNVLEKIKKAGMYVLSSDYEGVPNALLEAMALGLPVIATDCPIGGPQSLIKHRQNGLLVEVGNVSELSEMMKVYAREPAFARKCGHAATKVRISNSKSVIALQWKKFAERKI